MADKKKNTKQQADKPAADDLLLTDKITIANQPLPIDPETGDIIKEKLTEKQQEVLKKISSDLKQAAKVYLSKHAEFSSLHDAGKSTAQKIVELLDPALKGFSDYLSKLQAEEARDKIQAINEQLQAANKNLQPYQDLYKDIEVLEPFIKEELKKEEYGGRTFDDIMDDYTPGELLKMQSDPDSFLYKLFEAARARYNIVQRQQEGRDRRKETHQKAAKSNAVMELRQGNYLFFSQRELWDAFAPGRICKMGTLPEEYIDKDTGLIQKLNFDDGEIIPLNATDISYRAFALLNSILANTVENVHTEPVKNGEIKFYVKGVLSSITDDPRTLHDGQITIDRKTAGVLYLEKLFEPLQGYIGTTLNGSRYTVFNYIGYDFETDTMTVQLPYLYELWKSTQGQYFIAQHNKQKAIAENKRPKKADITPLKINALFKNKAYTADEITLEIAVYITNVLLAAGNKGKEKKTEIRYKTIIENCPRFKSRLQEIESNPEIKNPAGRYNDQLRKIATAFALIYDPDQCDALKIYDFIDIRPGRITKDGTFEFIPPTKRKLDDHLTIVWSRKPDDDLQ